MNLQRRQLIQATAGTALLGSLGLHSAHAQGLEQVKIVNGFPAGGSADVTSRRIGEKLGGSAYTKNAAVVENKTGAAGRIAVETVKNSAPDGATLLLTPYSMMSSMIGRPVSTTSRIRLLGRMLSTGWPIAAAIRIASGGRCFRSNARIIDTTKSCGGTTLRAGAVQHSGDVASARATAARRRAYSEEDVFIG